MNYYYFVKKQIKSHKILFFVAVAQMALSIYLILVLFDNINSFNYASKLFKKFDSGNLLYVTRTVNDNFEKDFEEDTLFENIIDLRTEYMNNGMNFYDANEKAWEELGDPDRDYVKIKEDDIRDMPYLENVSYMEKTNFITTYDPGDSDTVVTIDKEMCDLLNYELKSGKWLNKAESTNKTIDVVVANNTKYKLNDTIPIYTYENFFDETKEEMQYNIVDKGYKAKVIGILNYGDASLEMTDTDTWLDAFNLYNMIGRYNENTLIALKEDMNECFKEYGVTDRELRHTYVLTSFPENLNDEQYNEINDYLSKKRMVGVSMKRIYSNTIDYERNNFSNSVMPTLAAAVFAVFSIISISIFQMQYMNKKYQIYYYCGMEKGKEVFIQMFYSVIIIAAAMLISFGIYIGSGFIRYCQAIYRAKESGTTKQVIHSWYSISDFIHINSWAIIIIFILSVIITLLSTILCTFTIKYGKD